MLLKIYCENIVVEFLNCHFFFFFIYYFSFLSFFLSSIHFFFSSWFFSTTHVYPYIPILSLFFPLLSTFQNLPLSFFLQLSFSTFFFFFSFLIPTHYPAFSVIINKERGRERKNRWVRWLRSALCAAAPSAPARRPLHHQAGSERLVLSFFFLSYLLVLIQFYFKNWILFCVLCFVFGLCEKREEWEKKKSRGERNNWYNSSWDNFVSRKIDLELLQCSLN